MFWFLKYNNHIFVPLKGNDSERFLMIEKFLSIEHVSRSVIRAFVLPSDDLIA